MNGDPQILFHILKAIEWEIWMHAWFWPIGCCDVIILASELKKCNFHWWRHFCLRSNEIISLTDDLYIFLPDFDTYVVAETILYNSCTLHFSFWWRHHSEIFRLKATMHNFSYLRVMSMGGHFFSKHESAWQCSLSHISVVIAPFSDLQILVCCSWDYGLLGSDGLHFLIRCREHGQIFNWKLTILYNSMQMDESASWLYVLYVCMENLAQLVH